MSGWTRQDDSAYTDNDDNSGRSDEEADIDEKDERPQQPQLLPRRLDHIALHPLQHPFDFAATPLVLPPLSSIYSSVHSPPAVVHLDSLTVVSQLYQLAVTCLGPHSRPKLVHLNPNSPHVTLTTTCSRLFSPASNLPITQPLTQLLSHSLAAPRHADGGLYTLALTCRLISHAFLDAAPPLPVVLHAHQLALAHVLAMLSPSGGLLSEQPLTRLPAVLRFVRSILQSKPVAALSADDTDYLSVLIVQSVLSTLSVNADGSSQPSVIRYYDGVGFAVRDSEVYRGVILDLELPPPLAPTSSLRRYADLRVVLYNTSLAFDPSDHHSDLNIETSSLPEPSSSSATAFPTDSSSASIKSATPLITQLVDTWRALGVTAVFCQRVMHPLLRFLCHTHDMLTVDRLSIRHIHAVQAITAATIQSTLTTTTFTATHLGRCHAEERVITGRKRLCLSAPPQQRVAGAVTLVLCGRTESAQDELRVVVEQAVGALQAAIRDDGQLVVVGGGGVVERQLAQGLRQWLDERRAKVEMATSVLAGRDDVRCRRLQVLERGIAWGVREVVEMLEDVGRIIGGWDDEQLEVHAETGVEAMEVATGEFCSVNPDGDEVVSWRTLEGELVVDASCILDSAAAKRFALQRAVEVAAVAMRVKQVIKSQ